MKLAFTLLALGLVGYGMVRLRRAQQLREVTRIEALRALLADDDQQAA